MFLRIFALIATVSVLLWVLPLGVFIKPGQQKTACAGKRAVHQCLLKSGAAPADEGAGVKISSASSQTEKGASSSGGANDYVLPFGATADKHAKFPLMRRVFDLRVFVIPASIEHVPKPRLRPQNI